MILRPYQEKALKELREALREHRAAILCQPCGSGKGSLIAYMVQGVVKRGKRVIFAVHGRALVLDMSERVGKLCIEHGVLMGGRRRQDHHAVQVASIDTLHRMDPLPPADLIILDEARTFLSATGRSVLARYPDAQVIGMDATPARLDGHGLGVQAGGIFDVMVMGPGEQELIDLGFLVPSIVIGIEEPPDVSKVGRTGGDFNQKDLAAVCDKAKLVGNMVEHWLRHASTLKTIAFGVNQAHARHITEQFRSAGIDWAYADANTPDDEREDIWDRLDNGSLMGCSNVMIAGVGWDHPRVACVIAGRPTASLPLWRQMIGRASRPYPGKTVWKVLDHANNTMRHWPYGFFETPPVWSLEGVKRKPGPGEPQPPAVATCHKPMPVPEAGVPASFTGPLSPDGKYMLPSYHTFFSGPELCPYCGIPLKAEGVAIETEAGDLKDLSALREKAKAEAARWLSPADVLMKEKYSDLVRTQRERGYKPGYAAMMYKLEFGSWPPRGWKAELEAPPA